jgi:hypothetical protein
LQQNILQRRQVEEELRQAMEKLRECFRKWDEGAAIVQDAAQEAASEIPNSLKSNDQQPNELNLCDPVDDEAKQTIIPETEPAEDKIRTIIPEQDPVPEKVESLERVTAGAEETRDEAATDSVKVTYHLLDEFPQPKCSDSLVETQRPDLVYPYQHKPNLFAARSDQKTSNQTLSSFLSPYLPEVAVDVVLLKHRWRWKEVDMKAAEKAGRGRRCCFCRSREEPGTGCLRGRVGGGRLGPEPVLFSCKTCSLDVKKDEEETTMETPRSCDVAVGY